MTIGGGGLRWGGGVGGAADTRAWLPGCGDASLSRRARSAGGSQAASVVGPNARPCSGAVLPGTTARAHRDALREGQRLATILKRPYAAPPVDRLPLLPLCCRRGGCAGCSAAGAGAAAERGGGPGGAVRGGGEEGGEWRVGGRGGDRVLVRSLGGPGQGRSLFVAGPEVGS